MRTARITAAFLLLAFIALLVGCGAAELPKCAVARVTLESGRDGSQIETYFTKKLTTMARGKEWDAMPNVVAERDSARTRFHAHVAADLKHAQYADSVTGCK